MDQKYCIVEFFSETPGGTSPTEIVPNIWIDRISKLVYWPPKPPAALKVAIKKASEPPSQNWGIHRYNRILGEYGKFNFKVLHANTLIYFFSNHYSILITQVRFPKYH